MSRTVIVLAKAPRPGRVKTRLCPPLTFAEAATVARAALDDTIAVISQVECEHRVLALDECVDWLRPPGYRIIEQPDGGLADRLTAACTGIDGPTVLVGMDTPQITPQIIEAALATLRDPDDAALGLAEDGGFWLVGMTRPHPGAFAGVPMSTDRTGAAQLEQLRRSGCRVHQLPVLRDVDQYEDATHVANRAPGTRFACSHSRRSTSGRASTGSHGEPRPARHRLPARRESRRRDRRRAVDRSRDRCGSRDRPPRTWTGARRRMRPRAPRPGAGSRRKDRVGHRSHTDRSRARTVAGASVLHRSVFARVPGAGRWQTALLLDGNVGIGGNPTLLLRRVADLVAVDGEVLVELDPPGVTAARGTVRLEIGSRAGPWFEWSPLSVDDLEAVAREAGTTVREVWDGHGRWFAALVRGSGDRTARR